MHLPAIALCNHAMTVIIKKCALSQVHFCSKFRAGVRRGGGKIAGRRRRTFGRAVGFGGARGVIASPPILAGQLTLFYSRGGQIMPTADFPTFLRPCCGKLFLRNIFQTRAGETCQDRSEKLDSSQVELKT